MRKLILILSIAGVLGGGLVAHLSGITRPPLPPVFAPPVNPYPHGIYAQGILETSQPSGSNLNIFPEVTGVVRRIFVTEGQSVRKGDTLFTIDPSVQRGTTEQLRQQAQAARVALLRLRAEPRRESLDVADAQVRSAETVVRTARAAYDKQRRAFTMDPRAVSRNTLDSAETSLQTAVANLDVARRQRDLLAAGAWSYEIRNQTLLYEAAEAAYRSAHALLGKYTILAPTAGRVLAIAPGVGDYVSPQGVFDTYTQGMDPAIVLSGSEEVWMQVRCFLDEILVPRLPEPSSLKAQMSPRGSSVKIPLQYVRIQPVLSPKIQLSNQRQERVDVRVLPIIFRFLKPKGVNLFPGQLVDVFIGG